MDDQNTAMWAEKQQGCGFVDLSAGLAENWESPDEGLRQLIKKEFPAVLRVSTAALGPILLSSARREDKRLANGKT